MIQLADGNLSSFLRHLATTAPGGSYLEDERYLLFAGGHEYPGTYTNGVIRKSSAITPAELLARADAFFGDLGRRYMTWVRAHADLDLEREVRRRGYWLRPPDAGTAGIATERRLAPLPPPAPGTHVEIRRADDEASLHAYRDVIARGYQLAEAPGDMLETVLFSIDSLRVPEVTAFVAYRDEQPIGGSMAYVTGDVAGLQWLATVPEARGTGVGKRLFWAATDAAFDQGARCVTGQASAMGTPIWVAMGFSVVTRYRRYLSSG
jgi:GNAT superfamily N-acetyltransferase